MSPISSLSASTPSLLGLEPSPRASLGLRTSEKSASPSASEVQKATAQFEAILVRQLIGPAIEPMMSGSITGSNGAGASGGGVYGYMLTDTLANSIAQGGGLGLSQVLTRQLAPSLANSDAASATP